LGCINVTKYTYPVVVATDRLQSDVVAVAAPRVKTWFIIRRFFEPEKPSDAVPAGDGSGDAVMPHVIVKVENAVIDGGVTKEVMLLGSVT